MFAIFQCHCLSRGSFEFATFVTVRKFHFFRMSFLVFVRRVMNNLPSKMFVSSSFLVSQKHFFLPANLTFTRVPSTRVPNTWTPLMFVLSDWAFLFSTICSRILAYADRTYSKIQLLERRFRVRTDGIGAKYRNSLTLRRVKSNLTKNIADCPSRHVQPLKTIAVVPSRGLTDLEPTRLTDKTFETSF